MYFTGQSTLVTTPLFFTGQSTLLPELFFLEEGSKESRGTWAPKWREIWA